jgi:hypothetical protein
VTRAVLVRLGTVAALLIVAQVPASVSLSDSPAMPMDGSLSADPQGWAFHPTIAVAQDSAVYVAWSQHAKPENWQFAGIYVKRRLNGSWQSLGGRIGHSTSDPGAKWAEAYAPSLAIVDRTVYVTWYEGGGYGWGEIAGAPIRSVVFVAHWDGKHWALDANPAMPNGALNTTPDAAARTPALAVVGGILHAAWIETRRVPERGAHNVVVVKRLSGGQWVPLGRDLRAESADNTRILDVALADAGGVPHVAWSEATLADRAGRPVVHVARWSATGWARIGRSLNISRSGYANFVAMAGAANILYVAWQERSLTGNSQLYVKGWNGSDWSSAGGSLNADPDRGEAGRPALAGDHSRLWLAWTEGLPSQRAGLYARRLEVPGWSVPVGPLNIDRADGAPDSPALAAGLGRIFLGWAEKNPPPATKQIYVRPLQ